MLSLEILVIIEEGFEGRDEEVSQGSDNVQHQDHIFKNRRKLKSQNMVLFVLTLLRIEDHRF